MLAIAFMKTCMQVRHTIREEHTLLSFDHRWPWQVVNAHLQWRPQPGLNSGWEAAACQQHQEAGGCHDREL
jgi:hypothetical protein